MGHGRASAAASTARDLDFQAPWGAKRPAALLWAALIKM